MKRQETDREKYRHLAVAVLGMLLLWMIIGQAPGGGEIAPLSTHECVGLTTVEGDVNAPGTFLMKGLREGKKCTLTLKDFLHAAGGLKVSGPVKKGTTPFDEDRQIELGQKLVVTRLESGAFTLHLESLKGEKRLVWGEKLDVNEASVETLSLLPRMKSEFAESIVERRNHRPWKNLEALAEIRGVGPKTVQLWSNYLKAGTGD